MAPRSTKTVEELMKTSQISDRYWNEVDASIWYNEPSLEETNETALTTYAARRIADYTDCEDMQGLTILAAFQEDFEDWDDTRFNLVHKEYRRSLRLLLRKRGILSRTGTVCRHVTCGTFRAVALFKRARALRLSCSLFLLSRFVLYQF